MTNAIFTISFDDQSTCPDRLRRMAQECGVSPEDIILRAIAEYLGDRYLPTPPPSFKANSMKELFQVHGLTKPGK